MTSAVGVRFDLVFDKRINLFHAISLSLLFSSFFSLVSTTKTSPFPPTYYTTIVGGRLGTFNIFNSIS